MKRILTVAMTIGICSGSGWASSAIAAPADSPVLSSASGHGTLNDNGRQFSFNAKQHLDGTVTGQAQLVNKDFGGDSGPAPYRAHIDISCMHTVGNTVVLGGLVRSTNDSNLTGAAFFTVQDNGEPGGGVDQISRVAFFDEDPVTVGDPQLCLLTDDDAYTLTPIEHGNISVRPVG